MILRKKITHKIKIKPLIHKVKTPQWLKEPTKGSWEKDSVSIQENQIFGPYFPFSTAHLSLSQRKRPETEPPILSRGSKCLDEKDRVLSPKGDLMYSLGRRR